jgi:hypothetical protein
LKRRSALFAKAGAIHAHVRGPPTLRFVKEHKVLANRDDHY